MDDKKQTVRVNYAVSMEARRSIATKLGSLDPADAPSVPTIPGVALIPQKGDLLSWEALGDLRFVVAERLIRFKADDNIDVTLAVDIAP